MHNKYEREIEEILRNMDRTDTKTSIGNRIRSSHRPRARRSWGISLNRTEVLFLLGILLALVGAGLTYYIQGHVYVLADWLSINGIFGAAAFLCIVAGLIIAWRDRFRGVTSSLPRNRTWRGTSTQPYIVDITPRRGPLSGIATRFRLLRLKIRYWRTRGHE